MRKSDRCIGAYIETKRKNKLQFHARRENTLERINSLVKDIPELELRVQIMNRRFIDPKLILAQIENLIIERKQNEE